MLSNNKAILALKTVLTYFNNNEFPVFICSLDTDKTFNSNKAILALKTVLTYFNNNESPVFICSLDTDKTFSRINHYNFLTVLLIEMFLKYFYVIL